MRQSVRQPRLHTSPRDNDRFGGEWIFCRLAQPIRKAICKCNQITIDMKFKTHNSDRTRWVSHSCWCLTTADRCPRPRPAAVAFGRHPALVAQGIEHRPPEPCAQVRILPRAPLKTRRMQAKRRFPTIGASATDCRYLPLSATNSVTRKQSGGAAGQPESLRLTKARTGSERPQMTRRRLIRSTVKPRATINAGNIRDLSDPVAGSVAAVTVIV